MTVLMASEARKARLRFLVFTIGSSISALLAATVLAIGRQPEKLGLAAGLAFLAAVGPVVLGITHDRELAQLLHRNAVRLQRCLRTFETDAGRLEGAALIRRFKQFHSDFEEVKEEGDEILSVRGREPSRPKFKFEA